MYSNVERYDILRPLEFLSTRLGFVWDRFDMFVPERMKSDEDLFMKGVTTRLQGKDLS